MQPGSLIALSVLPAALAQYDSSGSKTTTATASSSSSAAIEGVHVVKVGDGGLTFDPSEVTAAVGHVVEFHFYPQAHSVAQSSFDSPCQPLNTTGFFSGPIPVQSGVSDTVFSVTVENENPMWFYCATGRHCQSGMVGVINAPSNGQRTLEQYAEAASEAGENTAPSSTGGGQLGAAATASPTTQPSSTSTPQSSAGMEARGSIRWGLLMLGIAIVRFI